MSLFSDNLKYLRDSKNWSQQDVSDKLLIKPARYSTYEYGRTEPPYDILIQFSHLYHISIDLMLTVNLRKIPTTDLIKLDDNRIVLPIAVDSEGENLIEIVPHKARAGYLTGYADAEFIENLQRISLPFLGVGKFRAFPVGGDSMPPHNDKSFVVGKYVENLGEITKNKTYILITLSEGITYKRLNTRNTDSITVAADNVVYHPYEIKLSDVLEIWEYVAHIGRDDSKMEAQSNNDIKNMFLEIKKEIKSISVK